MSLVKEGIGEFIQSDQCRFGQIDRRAGKPVKKRTG